MEGQGNYLWTSGSCGDLAYLRKEYQGTSRTKFCFSFNGSSACHLRTLYCKHFFHLDSFYHKKRGKGILIFPQQPGATQRAVTHAAVDTVVWQALASVMVPGFTINRVCAASLMVLAKTLPRVPLNTRKWVTTAIGLGCIPFIVHPIDTGVHWALDNSLRKYLDLSQEPNKE